MSEFKGAPGKWDVGSETIGGEVRIINREGSIVAMVEAKTGDGHLWTPKTIADHANLIAAAPELLKALIEARVWVQGWNAANESEESNKALIMCNKAIAKALGQ